ncbi:MAG: tyrosine-type recombinase/integrase [Eubacteriales bacterium]
MSRMTVEKNIAYDDVRKRYYVTLNYGKNLKTSENVKSTKTCKSLAEARKILRAHLVDIDKKTAIIPVDDTLESYLNYWYKTIALNNHEETTCNGYRNIIYNHLIPYFKKTKLQDINARSINEYKAYKFKEKMISNNTLRKHYDLLKQVLKNAVFEDLLATNPADKVKAPKTKKKEANVYSIEQAKELIKLSRDTRLEIVIDILLYAGLRRSEMLGLTWDNVDFERRLLHIRSARTQANSKIIIKAPKTEQSNRDIPICEELMDALLKEKSKQDRNKRYYMGKYTNSNYIVRWDNGRAYRPNYISEIFSNFIAKNNLEEITLHNLRHTFISIAINQGVDIAEVSRLAGHSRPSTTLDIYTHIIRKNNPDATNTIAKALND